MAIKNFVEELEWRGMIHTIMPGAKEQLEKLRDIGACQAVWRDRQKNCGRTDWQKRKRKNNIDCRYEYREKYGKQKR